MNYPTGNLVNDGLLVIQAAILLTQWIDFHVLHTPEKDFWMAEHFKGVDEGEKVTRVGVEKLGWKAKLGWVVDLKSRARGLGWNWRVKNIPSDPQDEMVFTSLLPIPTPSNVQQAIRRSPTH
jgi:hypothetical protein